MCSSTAYIYTCKLHTCMVTSTRPPPMRTSPSLISSTGTAAHEPSAAAAMTEVPGARQPEEELSSESQPGRLSAYVSQYNPTWHSSHSHLQVLFAGFAPEAYTSSYQTPPKQHWLKSGFPDVELTDRTEVVDVIVTRRCPQSYGDNKKNDEGAAATTTNNQQSPLKATRVRASS